MIKLKKRIQVPPLTPEKAAALSKRIDEISRDFTGQFEELESALGMLLIGRLVGWKVIAIIHNKRTIKKYEKILGIQIKTEFPPEGPLTYKSFGYKMAQKIGGFWKVVSGDVRVENRRE